MYQMRGSNILPYKIIKPTFGKGCFVAPGAQLIGDLIAGDDVSFWFNTVVRADCNSIRIGNKTNIQDCAVIHVTNGTGPTTIGSDVTIGHSAVLHACTIDDLVLIGMGSIILDGARVQSKSIVAAGSVLPPGREYPSGVLIMGSPAKIIRDLTDEEIKSLGRSVEYYLEYKKNYMTAAGV